MARSINREKMRIVFDYIVEYKRKHDGNSPSFHDIKDKCGISSTSVVSFYLNRLQADGKIMVGYNRRSIYVTGGNWTYAPEAQ